MSENDTEFEEAALPVGKHCSIYTGFCTIVDVLRATSHLSVRATAMRLTVTEVSPHLCKILTLVMLKTYLQTG